MNQKRVDMIGYYVYVCHRVSKVAYHINIVNLFCQDIKSKGHSCSKYAQAIPGLIPVLKLVNLKS
jgi:hypothetical protein